MTDHRVTIEWSRGASPFTYETYSRDHVWRFEGVAVPVAASAAVNFLGNGELADPEQAFVASLASCHMLTFLAVAARRRIEVERYEDEAVGHLDRDDSGQLAITRVILRPVIHFAANGGEEPLDRSALRSLHARAHRECFLANSVRCAIDVDLDRQWTLAGDEVSLDLAGG